MNFLRNVRSSLSGWFPKRDAINETPTGLGDIYYELMVETLSWNTRYTLHSLIFWLGFHILLFLSALNTLGCFFFTVMVFFVVDFLYRPTFAAQYTGQYSDDFRRLKQYVITSFVRMRHEAAILLYPVISALLWSLLMISTKVSGLVLSAAFVLCLYFLPLLMKRLPKNIYDYLEDLFRSLGTSAPTMPEEDLFPYYLEKIHGNRNSSTTEQSSDLLASSMPSYLEVAETSPELEEEDLLPHPSKSAISITPGDLSSDSDSDTKGMEFETHHFNSSSSEEDQFLVQPPEKPTANVKAPRTESDSDFEIIEFDEVVSLNS